MTHVLEHIREPVAALQKLRDLAKPTGSILLEVPNADDVMLPLFGGSYRPLCPGDHVSFFDEASLAKALRDAGWRVELVVSPLHARDVFYGAMMSSLDFLRTRGGKQLQGAGGVEAQTRYRGRFRRPIKRALDVLVEAVDPAVVELRRQLSGQRGNVLIAQARVA